ncbi:MAG: NAD(P)/FAD-dependent oxidoreductase [Actinomycetes bacterium]
MADSPDFDVLIVGAGITGIGIASQLERNLPGTSYAILESRERIGGTWDLFRYPGIRSDVDMYTFGYSFNPWQSKDAIGHGEAIREYLGETASKFGVDRKIRFGHTVAGADWSSEESLWRVRATGPDGQGVVLTARWLFSATGYFRYDQGHSPDFPGIERFAGTVVHPQHWPEDLDWSGKRVVVVGSGATAVTIVPVMAEKAAHVTMLQRSPSYMAAIPWRDPVVGALRGRVSPKRLYSIARRKSIFTQELVWNLSKKQPKLMRRMLIKGVERQLPDGYDVERDFTPKYDPWDQRLCVVPGGDLFRSIRKGSASVVTDRIRSFNESGIVLESGRELEADIVVTATGLDLLAFGGIELSVDGEPLDVSAAVTYRGMMITGAPNLICSFPYPHVAWTLRVEVVSEYFERLLRHMSEGGWASCVPVNSDPSLETQPFGDYTSNYVLRSRHLFPQSGGREPWNLDLNLRRDTRTARTVPLDDGVLRFSRGHDRSAAVG